MAIEHGAPTWSRTEQLLNWVLYTLRAANWSGKGKRPEPIPMDPPADTAPRVVSPSDRDALAAWKAGTRPR